MANYYARLSGNIDASNVWATTPSGTASAVTFASGDVLVANSFAITINTSTNLGGAGQIRNDNYGGATSGGSFTLSNGVTLTANINATASNSCCISSGSVSASVIGNITVLTGNSGIGIAHSSSGTLTITGNVSGKQSTSLSGCFGLVNSGAGTVNVTGTVLGGLGGTDYGINNTGSGTIIITGTVSGQAAIGVFNNTATGTVTITGSVNAGNTAAGASNLSAGTFTIIGDITATNGSNGFTASSASATNRLSGSFINSANGTAAVYAAKYILNTTPLNAKTRYAKDGISQYVDMYTADNNLAQANPTDVRTGVSYASGALTGTLTVPAEGTVSNGVTVGPLMPFTATRSSTTATATLAYSYPYVAGDTIVVTGASNAEWNGTYTIASVISGTSITFAVPVTYSLTAGTGAQMQTVGTAMLTAAAIFNTLTSTMTTSGSIGERLANVSTVAVTGQQITSALG